MTATITVRNADKIVVMCDGAFYDSNGYLTSFGVKCMPLPHLRAAIVMRGQATSNQIIASTMAGLGTFDEMVEEGADIAREIAELEVCRIANPRGTSMSLELVGFSESRDQAEGYVLQSDTSDKLIGEPWIFHPTDPFSAAPFPQAEMRAVLERLALPFDPVVLRRTFEPKRLGLAILEAQRGMSFPSADEEEGQHHVVGGFAMVTEVTRAGCSQTVIHRWPDEIGERIEPVAPPAVPSSPATTMSRQQRRAAERAAKRA